MSLNAFGKVLRELLSFRRHGSYSIYPLFMLLILCRFTAGAEPTLSQGN